MGGEAGKPRIGEGEAALGGGGIAEGVGDDVVGRAVGEGHARAQAIEAEAQTQALCMMTEDFNRAYQAFVAKQKPVFQGN